MNILTAIRAAVTALFFLSAAGCTSTGGSSGGWVVVQNPPPPSPPKQTDPLPSGKSNRGLERAAKNHLRSAYRFLAKNKPDQAIRQLEKARRGAGDSFWLYYYMGGAYYFRGDFKAARGHWQRAYRLTGDPALKSRLRTCQSFAAYNLYGEEKARDELVIALELDEDNLQAVKILKDLERRGVSDSRGSADKKERRPPSAGKKTERSPYVEEKIRGSGYEADEDEGPSGAGYDNWDAGQDEYDGEGNDAAARKGKHRKKLQPVKQTERGKTSKRLLDFRQFREFFLVEMR